MGRRPGVWQRRRIGGRMRRRMMMLGLRCRARCGTRRREGNREKRRRRTMWRGLGGRGPVPRGDRHRTHQDAGNYSTHANTSGILSLGIQHNVLLSFDCWSGRFRSVPRPQLLDKEITPAVRPLVCRSFEKFQKNLSRSAISRAGARPIWRPDRCTRFPSP